VALNRGHPLTFFRNLFYRERLLEGPTSRPKKSRQKLRKSAINPELARWIFGYDQDARVIEPAILRDVIARRANGICANYKVDSGWAAPNPESAPFPSCYMEEGEYFILATSWSALEGRRGSDLSPKVRKVMEKLMNVLGHSRAEQTGAGSGDSLTGCSRNRS
jgi:hypothetical protein